MLPCVATQHSAHFALHSKMHSQASSPTLTCSFSLSLFLSLFLWWGFITAFSIPQEGEYLKAMLMSLRLNEADVLR